MSHGEWVGFDLDGCLACYGGWTSYCPIGAPIKPMVDKVKEYLRQGIEVRIFTARVCDNNGGESLKEIADWCQEHIGQELKITNVKDYGMIKLYDDRCVAVECNTGRILGGE